MAKTGDPRRPPEGFAAPYMLYDRTDMPVTALAADYSPDHETPRHDHPRIQLIHAVRGVMVVSTNVGQWIVPPSRGLCVPAGIAHSIRMVGHVEMRTVVHQMRLLAPSRSVHEVRARPTVAQIGDRPS